MNIDYIESIVEEKLLEKCLKSNFDINFKIDDDGLFVLSFLKRVHFSQFSNIAKESERLAYSFVLEKIGHNGKAARDFTGRLVIAYLGEYRAGEILVSFVNGIMEAVLAVKKRSYLDFKEESIFSKLDQIIEEAIEDSKYLNYLSDRIDNKI